MDIGPLLCRVGLHSWSDNRGGIVICTRAGCRHATTYGLAGTFRRLRWRESLYTQYREFEDTED